MGQEEQAYNLEAIRDLMDWSFTEEELQQFCQERPLFQQVAHRFGPSQSLEEMVDEVMVYALRWDLFTELLSGIAETRPRQSPHSQCRDAVTKVTPCEIIYGEGKLRGSGFRFLFEGFDVQQLNPLSIHPDEALFNKGAHRAADHHPNRAQLGRQFLLRPADGSRGFGVGLLK